MLNLEKKLPNVEEPELCPVASLMESVALLIIERKEAPLFLDGEEEEEVTGVVGSIPSLRYFSS